MPDQRRELKPGELVAIDPKFLQQTDRGAFFWMFGSALTRNTRHGDVECVYIRDVLDHHEGWGDSYDAIVCRVQSALDGDAACKQWDQIAEWYGIENTTEKKGPRPEPAPAKTIVLSLDSPGGVVSGLNQTVEKLRRMCAEKEVKLIAYVNEKACSAAYALACACSEIYAPPSAIIGSIGVRSMMVDSTRADRKAGLTFVLIASGDRKLDGDPHQPIADAAVKEEQGRVDYLARQFFQLVGEARGKRLTAEKAQALQANVLIGKKAEKAGLIDAVVGWDALLAKLEADTAKPTDQPKEKKALADGVSKVTSSTTSHGSVVTQESSMRLTSQIKKARAAIASESDTKKKAKLQSKLDALISDDLVLAAAESLKKTKYKHETETEETEEDAPEEEDDDPDKDAEDEDADEDAEDEDKDKDAEDKDDDKDAEDDEGDKDAEDKDKDKDAEDESSEDEALAALTGHLKGKAKQRALGFLSALVDKASAFDRIQPQVAHLKATEEHRKRSTMIDDALKGRRITKRHARELREKPLAFVKDFLKMHTKAIYFTADDAEVPRDVAGNPTAPHAGVPREVLDIINASVFTQAPNDPKKQEELRSASLKAWRESQNGARH